MKSYFGGLLCLAWSQDGKYIATGGEDDLVTVFSFAELRVVLRARGHSSWVNCVAFDPWTTLLDDKQDNIEDCVDDDSLGSEDEVQDYGQNRLQEHRQ